MIFSERKQKIAKQMLKLEHKLLMYVLIAIKKKKFVFNLKFYQYFLYFGFSLLSMTKLNN